jgi:hypothetical protein
VTAVTEEEWRAGLDPAVLIEYIRDTASDRKMRLLAVACCRVSRPLLLNRELAHGVEVVERFADGQSAPPDLVTAYQVCSALPQAHWDYPNAEREYRRWAEAVAVLNAVGRPGSGFDAAQAARDVVWHIDRASHRDLKPRMSELVRCIFGNPFRPVALDPGWRTEAVVGLAAGVYADRAFDRLPVLADALEDAGCANPDVLGHCRSGGPHARGCWVVDLVLGKA